MKTLTFIMLATVNASMLYGSDFDLFYLFDDESSLLTAPLSPLTPLPKTECEAPPPTSQETKTRSRTR